MKCPHWQRPISVWTHEPRPGEVHKRKERVINRHAQPLAPREHRLRLGRLERAPKQERPTLASLLSRESIPALQEMVLGSDQSAYQITHNFLPLRLQVVDRSRGTMPCVQRERRKLVFCQIRKVDLLYDTNGM
jgi:hypothetical protein